MLSFTPATLPSRIFSKGVLEGAGIEAFLEDEFIGTLAPYTAAAGGAGAVKVLVAKSNMDRARTILEDFVNTAQRNDLNDQSEPSAGK